MVGKNDENGERLLPWTGELSADHARLEALAAGGSTAMFRRASTCRHTPRRSAQAARGSNVIDFTGATQRTPLFLFRLPAFNTSTKVP